MFIENQNIINLHTIYLHKLLNNINEKKWIKKNGKKYILKDRVYVMVFIVHTLTCRDTHIEMATTKIMYFASLRTCSVARA